MSRFQKSDSSVTKVAFVYLASGQISDIVNGQRFTTFARPSLRRCRTLPCLSVGISGCPSIFNTYTITGTPFCEPNHIIQRIPLCNDTFANVNERFYIRNTAPTQRKLFNHGSQSCRLGITSAGDYIFSPNVVCKTLRLVNLGLCGPATLVMGY